MINLREEWSKQRTWINLVGMRYPEAMNALFAKEQNGWDLWIEEDHPSEEDQANQLEYEMENVLPGKIKRLYIEQWTKSVNRKYMQIMVDMLQDFDCTLNIADERVTLDDLYSAWNSMHPDEDPVYPPPGFEL